ncbi:MAG: ATP-binding cassette domain-containing protein [Geodermatophilaceae bacterium]|nr:ATP-binding cassette domain-containing protein [Geodermatophilaceae bacterium]
MIGAVVTDLGDGASDLTPWVALVVAAAALATLGTWLEGRFATEASRVLRRRVLRGAFGVDPEHVRREGAGAILGRIMEVEPVAGLAATGGLQALVAAVEVAVAGAVLVTVPVGRPLALVLLGVTTTAVILLRVHVARLTRETGLRMDHTGRLLEDLAGQRTRRVQGAGPADPTTAYARAGARSDRTTALVSVGATGLWQVLALATLTVSGLSEQASAEQLAVALGAVLLAAAGLRRGGVAALGLTTAAIAARELTPLLRPRPYRHQMLLPPAGRVLTAEDVELRRGTTTILSGVQLALAAGDRVLLSGPSGSGKSTLVEALAGLRPAVGGRVTGRAGLAPQFCDDHVLLAPMAFNLLLARGWPAAETDLRDAWELCGELGLGGLLARMPAGLAQVVGETGWQLSNGERALVGLARALLAGPDVLVVDESLGPLDPLTARSALAVARQRVRTLVVVSQE